MSPQTLQRSAAAFGLTAVALGAFGAHALHDLLEQNARVDTWGTAAFYHLVHAVVLVWLTHRLASAGAPEETRPGALKLATWAFIVGIVIFSGSLYLLSVTDIRWLGAITPIGGLALMTGWVCLALSTTRSRHGG